jgi:hypothetical protein
MMPGRRTVLIVAPASAAFVALVALAAASARSAPDGPASSRKPDSRGAATATLSAQGWEIISEGDFEERTADSIGSRVRLRAATRGTRSDSVKFLGVRSQQVFRLEKGTTITADLDWNDQANGSYLSAGLALAPPAASGNPNAMADSLRIEYIGVPPGKNARLVIAARQAGREQYLHKEGWPEVNREGRKIGRQRLQLVIGKAGAFSVLENGKAVFESKADALPLEAGRLTFYLTLHSNYPPREVFFDNVRVESSRK